MIANPLQTFGKRSVPPCGDCDSDGDCTMNCGPRKGDAVYSYTGNEDGDFVIWKGETFVANVGGAALAEVGKQQIAFDADKAHAELIVNALNAYEKLTRQRDDLLAAHVRIGNLATAPIGPIKSPAHIGMEAKRIARAAIASVEKKA